MSDLQPTAYSIPHVATPIPSRQRSAPTRRMEAPKKQPSRHKSGKIAIAASALEKSYRRGKVEVPVLRSVDFQASAGQITAIVGQSGSGKSTLLHLLGTLDQPDAGEVTYLGERVDNLPRRKRDAFRNHQLGMIFQFYHLLPELNVIENVLSPVMIRHTILGYLRGKKHFRQRAENLLELVGLGHRMHHRPHELSGGEMQRTAIARALINDPQLLLADEPTGNLDQETGAGVLQILRKLNEENGLTIVMVTHDESIAQSAHQLVRLVHGQVEVVR